MSQTFTFTSRAALLSAYNQIGDDATFAELSYLRSREYLELRERHHKELTETEARHRWHIALSGLEYRALSRDLYKQARRLGKLVDKTSVETILREARNTGTGGLQNMDERDKRHYVQERKDSSRASRIALYAQRAAGGLSVFTGEACDDASLPCDDMSAVA